MNHEVKEEDVIIQGEVKLAGTVTIPTGSAVYPAVLILPGSGSSDRDGNGGGLNMNIYKELAHFLTRLGFVTLRFDKRGTHQSDGDQYTRGMWDLVGDAAACLRFLKQHEHVDETRTIILGHSEGAQIAPSVYLKERTAGMMLLCGGAMGLREMLVWQRRQAYDALNQLGGFKGWLIKALKVTEKAEKSTTKFEEKLMRSTKPTIRVAGKKFPAKWMREFYQYDVCKDLRQVSCPVLVIAGAKDCQVPLAASEQIAPTVAGEAELHVIENMTHILKCWGGVMDASNPIKIYRQMQNEPLAQEFTSCLASWLKQHSFSNAEKRNNRLEHKESMMKGEDCVEAR